MPGLMDGAFEREDGEKIGNLAMYEHPMGTREPDREGLVQTLAKLREENRLLKSCLATLLFEKFEIDKESVLRGFGKEPPIEQLIEEMEREFRVGRYRQNPQ
jgi:hypothetical protein